MSCVRLDNNQALPPAPELPVKRLFIQQRGKHSARHPHVRRSLEAPTTGSIAARAHHRARWPHCGRYIEVLEERAR